MFASSDGISEKTCVAARHKVGINSTVHAERKRCEGRTKACYGSTDTNQWTLRIFLADHEGGLRRDRATKRLQLGLQFPYTLASHTGRQIDVNIPALRIALYPLQNCRYFLFSLLKTRATDDTGEVDNKLLGPGKC